MVKAILRFPPEQSNLEAQLLRKRDKDVFAQGLLRPPEKNGVWREGDAVEDQVGLETVFSEKLEPIEDGVNIDMRRFSRVVRRGREQDNVAGRCDLLDRRPSFFFPHVLQHVD